MAIVVAAGQYTGIANTKSADLISGSYQFVGRGRITLVAKASAIAMNLTLICGGVALCNDMPCLYYGTAGTVSINDNIMVTQVTNGGRVEFYIRNTGAATPTLDYMVLFEPM
jgi:uncharacterized protein (UPF0333 family)